MDAGRHNAGLKRCGGCVAAVPASGAPSLRNSWRTCPGCSWRGRRVSNALTRSATEARGKNPDKNYCSRALGTWVENKRNKSGRLGIAERDVGVDVVLVDLGMVCGLRMAAGGDATIDDAADLLDERRNVGGDEVAKYNMRDADAADAVGELGVATAAHLHADVAPRAVVQAVARADLADFIQGWRKRRHADVVKAVAGRADAGHERRIMDP